MANSNGWGDGAANNAIGWGQGANNAIGWGFTHATSWAGLTDISGAPTTDADAQAFITAAAITDPTQQAAINTLVVDLKGYSIWSKMKAIYPFLGSTASQHKFNLKDPRDLDAAFRLVFSGGWTHSSTGALPNGTNAYADTKLNPSISLGQNSTHLSYYSRTNISANQIETGVSAYSPVVQTYLLYSFSGVSYRTINRAETISGSIATPTTGLLIGSRVNSTTEKYYKSGSLLSTVTVNSAGLVNGNIFLGSTNNISAGSAVFYSSKQTAFASIGDGLTDTEAANFYTAVQAFQTTLGRSIGTQTVSDADAQAFVTNAGIVDQVEANAINNLVIGMKADGLWTKMKGIYPFVGGMASTNKFNLKDPRDLDAAFRLQFNGGWTHSSTGALPNGTNGYADTFLNDNTVNTLNNVHISVYSRTNTTTQSADISSYDGINLTSIYPFLANAIYTMAQQTIVSAVTPFVNSLGLFIANRTNSTQLFTFKNTTKYTSAFNSLAKSNQNFILSRASATTGNFSDRQLAFASIGDGLTDTEAANLNSRVTTFQTTLNRNI